jgi:hypothetical protein
MNSSTSRTLEKQKEQDDIRRQIELLKAKLVETGPEPELEGTKERSEGHGRKRGGDVESKRGELMLAPNTPSPRMYFFVFSVCF